MTCYKLVTTALLLHFKAFPSTLAVGGVVFCGGILGKIRLESGKKCFFNLPKNLLQLLQTLYFSSESNTGKGFQFVTNYFSQGYLSQLVTNLLQLVTSLSQNCYNSESEYR